MPARFLHSVVAVLSLVICLPWFTAAGVNGQGRPEAAVRVTGLRTEYKENPLGIDARRPRLSWRIESERRGVAQTARRSRSASATRT